MIRGRVFSVCFPTDRLAAVVWLALLATGVADQIRPARADDRCTFPLPAPSEIGVNSFEQRLKAFLGDAVKQDPRPCYETLGWQRDFNLRSTGPLIADQGGAPISFGTHGSGLVRIYYSPELIDWLVVRNRQGAIADGAMLIKEMYTRDDKDLNRLSFGGYAIMVRDSKGAWDGWLWTDGELNQLPAEADATSEFAYYPDASFGQYCVNCHSSADAEQTYATLRNLIDPSVLPNVNEAPITYATAIPTMPESVAQPERVTDLHLRDELPRLSLALAAEPGPDPHFWARFPNAPAGYAPVKPAPMPFSSYDHVVQGPQPDRQRQFITSDNCIGCHDATLNTAALPNMTYRLKVPQNGRDETRWINLSPFAEWRYSMMGLSGRDPIFFAQLETERHLFPSIAAAIDNKCLSCHGVMGQRSYVEAKGEGALFTHDLVRATPASDPADATYGALARDGVSCTACHRIEADGLGTFETYTGQFKVAAEPTRIYGPYEDVRPKPMRHALGLTPEHAPQIAESKLCGSCHTVFTPSLDAGGRYTRSEFDRYASRLRDEFHEQTTYFEWQNSVYSTETSPPGAEARSCQQCHMPSGYNGETLSFKIANIEDDTFAYVDNRLADKDLALAVRSGDGADRYARHALHGINLFATSMYHQFPWLLGVPLGDPMTGTFALDHIVPDTVDFAKKETAKIDFERFEVTGDKVTAEVKVTNLAGHKLPSGVGFRRAFITFQVLADGRPVWTSGATDAAGIIGTERAGVFTPLATEFLANSRYQPHYDAGATKITREDQVQIYEELVADSAGDLTTSFLSLRTPVKDNRLLPKGWAKEGPEAKYTKPEGGAANDPDYQDGSGTDRVTYEATLPPGTSGKISATATLYYQAIPPYYLNQRLRFASQPATDALAWFVQNLAVTGPLESWKLKLAEASVSAS